MKEKGYTNIFLIIILLVGLTAGIYLVQQQQNFSSMAAEFKAVKTKTDNGQVLKEENKAAVLVNGKLDTERAEELAKLAPKSYQNLVKKGLISNPADIKTEGGFGSPTPPPLPKLTPPNISNCGDITSSGSYSLSQDLISQGLCLNIHDAQAVNLDCQNHQINAKSNVGALWIKNIQNFSVKNCVIQSIKPTGESGNAILILDSNLGKIQNNIILKGYIDVANSHNLQIADNSINGHYQQYNSSSNYLHDNSVQADTTSKNDLAGVVISNRGRNNRIQNNVIDGGWDNVDHSDFRDYKGADDGVIITWETQDIVSGNIIKNNWDCGIETAGVIQNTSFSHNQINNSGLCGIGGWYWNSWLGNTIDANTVDKAAYLFYLFRAFGLDQQNNEKIVYFKDNTFSDNKFLHQIAGSYVGATQQYSSVIDFYNLPADIPISQVQIGNNLFKNNDFDKTVLSPILIPPNTIVDQGGNQCLPVDDITMRPLVCVATPTIACTACSADVNKDSKVNLTDFNRLKLCLNKTPAASTSAGLSCTPTDINGDGKIDTQDYDCLKQQFGKQCK